MDKVRQVGESYELNKYKTLNRTIELDARLATERLLAAKVRLNQLNGDNEKLGKQLRLAQAQCREQEKRLLVSETMLRQFLGPSSSSTSSQLAQNGHLLAQLASGRQQQAAGATSQLATSTAPLGAGSNKGITNRLVRFGARIPSSPARGRPLSRAAGSFASSPTGKLDSNRERRFAELEGQTVLLSTKTEGQQQKEQKEQPKQQQQVSSAATQTEEEKTEAPRREPSRTRMIISDLKQRLNLSSSSAAAAAAKVGK